MFTVFFLFDLMVTVLNTVLVEFDSSQSQFPVCVADQLKNELLL